jgi:hypothetical protein
LLAEVAKFEGAKEICTRIEQDLLNKEHFVWQKFLLFTPEHMPEAFWEIPDNLYPHSTSFAPISRMHFRWCLRRIYDARSEYVH